jgi:hypothetical protein
MGCQTKIQVISRKKSEQWYVNFPAAIAHAMEFDRGELFEWIIEDRETMVLRRLKPSPSVLKKKRQTESSDTSTNSGSNACQDSLRTEQAGEHEK